MKLENAFDLNRGEVVSIHRRRRQNLIAGQHGLRIGGGRLARTRHDNDAFEPRSSWGFSPVRLKADANASVISQALNEKQFVLLFDEVRAGRVHGPPLGVDETAA